MDGEDHEQVKQPSQALCVFSPYTSDLVIKVLEGWIFHESLTLIQSRMAFHPQRRALSQYLMSGVRRDSVGFDRALGFDFAFDAF